MEIIFKTKYKNNILENMKTRYEKQYIKNNKNEQMFF